MERRFYRSDDRDLEGHDLDLVILPPDGNGDWYVSVLPHGHKIGPTVRVTTSGTPADQHMVPAAVAKLYRAMGGESIEEHDETRGLMRLLDGGAEEIASLREQIERLTRERDAALGRANALASTVTTADVDKAVALAATKVRADTWERAARDVAAGSDARGQTILKLQNRLRRWKRRHRRAMVALNTWKLEAMAWKARAEEANQRARAAESASGA